MKVKILDLSHKDLWNSYITDLPVQQQDIYYTPEHYELYERKGDGQTLCFLFEWEGEFALYPFLLNSINDLNLLDLEADYFDIEGAYGYNGVISSCKTSEFKAAFYKAFNEYCADKNIVAEFVRFHPILENYEFSDPHIAIQFNRKTVFLELQKGYEWIWNNAYSSNNRNMIRKARKKQLEVFYSDDVEDYSDFYDLYSETMQAVGAESYYFFSEEYFMDFKHFIGDCQRIIKIYHNGEFICGLLLVIYKNFAHYFLSARKKEFGQLAANNLALDEAIQMAIKAKCRIFHFGGGNSALESDPLFKFKSRFSRQTTDFKIGKKIHDEVVYKKIVSAWEKQYPERAEKYKNFLLKYRM